MSRTSSAERAVEGRTPHTLVGVTVAALLVRLWDLGARVFHWDEGRVGFWTLRYAETGQFEYAPIIHGPFLRLVNATVFGYVPPTDFSARLVVALVGGLLPLSAWLFRDHLRNVEVVALGVFLAFNPVLVYFSRFMRNDVLVGGFAVVALGFAIRALAARDVRYAYPSVAFLALSVTTKANTLLYVLCFAGATVLLLDHRLVRTTRKGTTVRETLREWGRATATEIRGAAGERNPLIWIGLHVVGTMVTFVAIVVFFYAPRPELYRALTSPTLLPAVVHEATIGSGRKLADLWLTGGMQENPYLEYLYHEANALVHGGAVVVAFALVGFVVDGYGRRSGDAYGRQSGDGESRALVAFAFYWAVASLVGYPAATDINAPWTATHIVLPLTIPAAVGLAYVVTEGWAAYDAVAPDRETVALAGLVLLVASAGLVAPTATYWNSTNPDHREMVQWAQPHNDARESLDAVEAVINHHDGNPDVLFYSTERPGRGAVFYVENESVADEQPAAGGWYDRLPIPWYYERAGATTASTPPETDPAKATEDAPPIVIAHAESRSALEPHLDGYVVREHEMRLWSFRVVFFIDEAELDAATS